MQNYPQLIATKYPGAIAEENFQVIWMPDPALEQQPYVDENGQVVMPDNSNVPLIPVITLWTLPDPPPTFAELDAYAESPEYLATWGAKLKAEAEAQVNDWANQSVMTLKILEPELFYVAMVSNVAFRLLEWNSLGKPEEVDPVRFVVTHAEAQAYRETSAPGMTPADLLRLQESRWNQMQQGFATIVYKRRLALEKTKLAPVDESLSDALAAILAELDTVETIP